MMTGFLEKFWFKKPMGLERRCKSTCSCGESWLNFPAPLLMAYKPQFHTSVPEDLTGMHGVHMHDAHRKTFTHIKLNR